ncbi:hypothetical protein CC80DRAFT_490341 [Byssothecium circinans]|uniref:Uncharacterized protein n=1 Tax=Byssothecium circinans TaxID=147558 RepID=A0A6A5U979_9PLEO|nr:hypothetical protein CC80DRAFT_490341 [Byssothecium circinans]
MKFKENDIYQDLSHENDHYWQELLTPNGGFLIKLDEEGNAHRHGIGMFHQLHCLQMIRQALQARGGSSRRPYAEYTRHGFGEKEDDGHDPELHMLHCLDYLRQSVMCLADDTIEPPKRNSLGRGAIDGMITHQCRDSKPLYDMSRASPEWYRYASGNENDEVRGEGHHH